jgi:hypothetical protein
MSPTYTGERALYTYLVLVLLKRGMKLFLLLYAHRVDFFQNQV